MLGPLGSRALWEATILGEGRCFPSSQFRARGVTKLVVRRPAVGHWQSVISRLQYMIFVTSLARDWVDLTELTHCRFSVKPVPFEMGHESRSQKTDSRELAERNFQAALPDYRDPSCTEPT